MLPPRGVAQPGLERYVRDVEVAGSNPVAPIEDCDDTPGIPHVFASGGYHSGDALASVATTGARPGPTGENARMSSLHPVEGEVCGVKEAKVAFSF